MAIIYLVGARGSGKSVIGRSLANKLGCQFVDLDHYLCQREGREVAEIVGSSGWREFRILESRCLVDASKLLARFSQGVLATGGGAVLLEENRNHMRQSGIVFWLAAAAELLEKRLAANPNNAQRPSLTGKGLLEEIREVLAQREALYAACAHHRISADQEIEEICSEILEIIRERH